jgi:hypothetical protein
MPHLVSLDGGGQKIVGLILRRQNPLGKRSAIVFRHAVLPLQKVRDGLWLDSQLDPSQARQEEIHFAAEADRGAHLLRSSDQLDQFPSSRFQQTPTSRNFVWVDQSGWSEVEPLTSHALLWLHAKRLCAIREKISARDLTFNDNRVAGSLPPDGIRSLAAGRTLFGQYNPAAVAAKPCHCGPDQLLMIHDPRFSSPRSGEK